MSKLADQITREMEDKAFREVVWLALYFAQKTHNTAAVDVLVKLSDQVRVGRAPL